MNTLDAGVVELLGSAIPILEQRTLRGQKLHLCVQHTDAVEEAQRLAGKLDPTANARAGDALEAIKVATQKA